MANKWHKDPTFTREMVEEMYKKGDIAETQYLSMKVRLDMAEPDYVPDENSEIFKIVAKEEKRKLKEALEKEKAEKKAAKAAKAEKTEKDTKETK